MQIACKILNSALKLNKLRSLSMFIVSTLNDQARCDFDVQDVCAVDVVIK